MVGLATSEGAGSVAAARWFDLSPTLLAGIGYTTHLREREGSRLAVCHFLLKLPQPPVDAALDFALDQRCRLRVARRVLVPVQN